MRPPGRCAVRCRWCWCRQWRAAAVLLGVGGALVAFGTRTGRPRLVARGRLVGPAHRLLHRRRCRRRASWPTSCPGGGAPAAGGAGGRCPRGPARRRPGRGGSVAPRRADGAVHRRCARDLRGSGRGRGQRRPPATVQRLGVQPAGRRPVLRDRQPGVRGAGRVGAADRDAAGGAAAQTCAHGRRGRLRWPS